MGTHHPNGGAREAGRGRRGAAGVSLGGLRWLAALVPPVCLVHKRAFGWLYILGLVGGAVTAAVRSSPRSLGSVYRGRINVAHASFAVVQTCV